MRTGNLGSAQLAFSYEAFVRFVDTLDPILVLAGTLGQLLGDHINTAGGVATGRGRELYELAGAIFVVRHGVSTPRRKSVYHICGRRVLGRHGSGGGGNLRQGLGRHPPPGSAI